VLGVHQKQPPARGGIRMRAHFVREGRTDK
jgi:hypothetical protein